MVTADPTNVIDVVRTLLDTALRRALAEPGKLDDFFTQAGKDAKKTVDKVERIPDDIAKKLKEPPFKPPDWWSLLVYAVVTMRDLLDDDHLTVGYRHPDGWSRMLTLNYSANADNDANLDNTMAATLGVAITDPEVKQGISLQILKDIDTSFGSDALRITIKANGAADWQYVFGETMTPPTLPGLPGSPASAAVTVTWKRGWNPNISVLDGAFTFDVGPLILKLALSAPTDPLYTLTIGLGDQPAAPGVAASVNPAQALGAAGSFIHIDPIKESYSPQLTIKQGDSPQFDLGHQGL